MRKYLPNAHKRRRLYVKHFKKRRRNARSLAGTGCSSLCDGLRTDLEKKWQLFSIELSKILYRYKKSGSYVGCRFSKLEKSQVVRHSYIIPLIAIEQSYIV